MAAEEQVMGTLLRELVAALLHKGLLARQDVAGVLLRTEARSEMDDAFGEEGIMPACSEFSRLLTEDWKARFSLTPDLYALRLQHTEWLRNGSKGNEPLHPEEISRLYGD